MQYNHTYTSNDPVDLKRIYTVEFENMSRIPQPIHEVRNIIYFLCDKGFPITPSEIREPGEVLNILSEIDVKAGDEIPPELFAASLHVVERFLLEKRDYRLVSDVLAELALKGSSVSDPMNTIEILVDDKIRKLAGNLFRTNLALALHLFIQFASDKLIKEISFDQKAESFQSIDERVINGVNSSADIHSLFARINILLTKSLEPRVKLEDFLKLVTA